MNNFVVFIELITGGTIEFLLKTYGPFEENLFIHQILERINYIHSRIVYLTLYNLINILIKKYKQIYSQFKFKFS